MYKLAPLVFGKAVLTKDNGDGSFVSFFADPVNTDYQAFLRWCEEGNTPLPADEVTNGS
jgi:hypothetical protein